jgi:hypothetical protein
LPYLPNIDRRALAAQLGDDITVTRTAVEMPLYIEDMGSWQPKLQSLLETLALGVQEGVMS